VTALSLRILELRVVTIALLVVHTLACPSPLLTADGRFAEALVMLVERARDERPLTVFTDLGLFGHSRTESQRLTATRRRWNQGDFRGSPEEDERSRRPKKMGPGKPAVIGAG
jgi:hypothetical protein